MLTFLLRSSLRNRGLVLLTAIGIMIYGAYTASIMPIDVFPNLTRPRVVLLTEAEGMAPEEIETLVTFPLESAINGAAGVEAVRSQSGIGLSVITIDFSWDTEIYHARQIVQERLALARETLPAGIEPFLAPVSSLMGQIVVIGMWVEPPATSPGESATAANQTTPLELRTLADWLVRQRLLAINGVAQVITMGGGRKQFQVLVNPDQMFAYGVTLADVDRALGEGNLNVTGGYVEQGLREYLIRGLGRVESLDDIAALTVKEVGGRAVTIGDVARVIEGPQAKRGDASVNGHYPGVLLTVLKAPTGDTRRLTELVEAAIAEIEPSLPADVRIDAKLYQQREFIDLGVANVLEALRDGSLWVVVILFLFLLNIRTTAITLTAIPLSVLVTLLVFRALGLTINVMTLGGLAIAIGELVDDAIVDVENIYRRLREAGGGLSLPDRLRLIYQASMEIRSSIVFGTAIVILVFLPLFALSGIEGRLFLPLGIGYVVSILASLIVSLTITPVLSSYFLSGTAKDGQAETDGFVLRALKTIFRPLIRLGFSRLGFSLILTCSIALVVAAALVIGNLGTDFLPPFDEGAAQITMFLEPGASLEASNRLARMMDEKLAPLVARPDRPNAPLRSYLRRSGRAELDEHAEGVSNTELILALNQNSGLSREETLAELRAIADSIPGATYEVEQPLAHMISHMLSGVNSQIAIKLFGDDLDVLRTKAEEIRRAIADLPGIAPPVVEQQQLLPQVRIELDRERLAFYALTPAYVNQMIETALHGRVISTVLEGQRTFDLVLRFDEPYRTDRVNLHRLTVPLPSGARIPLEAVAKVYDAAGPSTIKRDDVRRRIAIMVNTTGGNVGGRVGEIQRRITERVELPEGYFLEYSGQFESQQEATRLILLLSLLSLMGTCVLLYSLFPSASLVLQILCALPAAFVGGVAALALTGQTLSVASMVGFISLGGIATRNGILLISHYLHLQEFEGETFSEAAILRGSLERLAPVLMTALTTGIGLVPLVWGGQAPGREILYPVATVIVGGLISSSVAEFFLRPGLFWWFGRRASAHVIKLETGDPESWDIADP